MRNVLSRARIGKSIPKALLIGIITVFSLGGLLPSSAHGQAPAPAGVVKLSGTVRDAQGKTVARATVEIRGTGAVQQQTVLTDENGKFRFSSIPAGKYTLHSRKGGFGEITIPQLDVGPSATTQVDLTLVPSDGSSSPPEFFDQPSFTVAGVTDASNLGGHGSNATSKTRAELTKGVVALPGQPKQSALGTEDTSIRERALRETISREPNNADANRELGVLLSANGKGTEAIPYLKVASRLYPGDFTVQLELATALAGNHQYQTAKDLLRTLAASEGLTNSQMAATHHLSGQVEEKLGNSLEAVRHYQRAAELAPTEDNLFDWGAELLLHNAPEPATEVFENGHRLFPQSARLLLALGVAWYARGVYDKAVEHVGEASDLVPESTAPYVFLAKLQSVDPTARPVYAEKLARFARQQPDNAWANYYYALSLWKQRKGPEDVAQLREITSLLEKAVSLDPAAGAAYVLLGAVYSESGQLTEALAAYQRATQASPDLAEAHYRLAQAYRRSGDLSKAQAELAIYDELTKSAAAAEERDRHEIQQFVYTLQSPAPSRRD